MYLQDINFNNVTSKLKDTVSYFMKNINKFYVFALFLN